VAPNPDRPPGSARPAIRPLVLCVLDGFGLAAAGPHNAIALADTPHWDRWWAECPQTRLSASGEDVGLPAGLMGNSEVGHLNLGAGRVVDQPQMRITRAIRDGSFFANPAFRDACAHARERGGALHLMGLVSDGGVHSHLEHVPGFLELARREGIRDVWLHAFTDGRDTPPTSGVEHVQRLEAACAEAGVGRIASVIGRYDAMDRDRRWDRTEKAWRCLVLGEGERARSAEEAVRAAYARGVTDEFVPPTAIVDAAGEPLPRIRSGDAVLHLNFRPDRARQLTYAFTRDDFDGFARPERPRDLAFVCLTRYDETLEVPVAFPPGDVFDTLGDIYAAAGLRQLRIAETEKYAHVTYFFSGGREAPSAGEERCLVPSPQVATYDLEPDMSAPAVTDETIARLERTGEGALDLVVLNYANADMVGHTGKLEPTVRAVTTLDRCLGRLEAAVRAAGGLLVVTADHGNAEQMWDEKRNEPHTAHTTNPVPLVLVGDAARGVRLDAGGLLCDVAPTVLDLVGLPRPAAMTGRSLLVR
jgi:2,3-bisphosphoglycerate-independent phosphoglycerate mutase